MFNINLKRIRYASGKTQKELADYLQISAQSISKWETSEATPSLEYLPKIAKFFGCSVNSFFTTYDPDMCKKISDSSDTKLIKMVTKTEEKINKALEHFGVDAEVVNVFNGYRIVTYDVLMHSGVGISDILKHKDNILHYIRNDKAIINTSEFEENHFAFEIAKDEFTPVDLASVLKSDAYKVYQGELPIVLGYDSKNNVIFDDITNMPHMLIGGKSGTGKSTFLQNVIACLTSRCSPEDVKLVILDPKGADFDFANVIPHMMCSVVKNTSEAVEKLQNMVDEISLRKKVLEAAEARNIKEYNKKITSKMPRIVVLIDELFDIMIRSEKVEELIVKIAQHGRSVGIHMIVGSQVANEHVFTPVIKANVPTRAILNDDSASSELLINSSGAERLALGGDMLYMSVVNENIMRIQTPIICAEEIINNCHY